MSDHYVTFDENNTTLHNVASGPALMVSRSVEISTQTDRRDPDEDEPQGSIIGAVFIMMNAVLGAGILEFPYTFSQVGITTALQMLAFVIIFAIAAHIILARAVDIVGGRNYQELIGLACGSKLQALAQFCLLLYCFGSCLTYMVTIGDQLTSVCEFVVESSDKQDHYCQRYLLTPLFCLGVIFPIIWIRNISSFGYVSFFSVASVFYLVSAVVTQYFLGSRTNDDIWYPKDNSPMTILSILPVLSFGYQCHMTSVPLYAELSNRSIRRYSFVILISMTLVTLAYLLLGILGFMTFGHAVKPDIIVNYPANSIMLTVGRFAVAFSVSMTYPIVLFIGRAALEDSILMVGYTAGLSLRRESEVRRVVIIFAWFSLTLLIACFANSIKDVISIVGSIAALFMFFFPGILFLLYAGRIQNNWFRFVGSFFVALGCFVFIWNIVGTVYEHTRGHPVSLQTWWSWSSPSKRS